MNVGQNNLYEDLNPHDAYFFKVGGHNLVCFHGRNYSIKKRLTAEQTAELISDKAFFRTSTNCYVNLHKVAGIQGNLLIFRDPIHGIKSINVPRRNLEQIKRLAPALNQEVAEVG